MSTPILEVKNLTKIYRARGRCTRALNKVSLQINEGEILALLGVNGAGKTTLSSILATLHPPTEGEVLYKGESIYDNVMAYRRTLGLCPQKPNLDPYLNVTDNLRFAGRYYLLPAEKIEQRLEQIMKQFGLERYAQSQISELSGGWKQRLLIARALMHEPKIVILDEPTVGLDPEIRRALWQIIRDLKAAGVTVILTTHYLDEADALADRACILHLGNILMTERISALKEKHGKRTFEEVFLEIVAQQEE